MQQNEPLQLTLLQDDGKPKTWTLQPTSGQYTRLAQWIQGNRWGWLSYVAATPGSGLLVDTATWRLQFLKTTVLACRLRESCVYKDVRPEEYEYLVQSQPNQD